MNGPRTHALRHTATTLHFSESEKMREQPEGAGRPGRKLSEEAQAGVDVGPRTHLCERHPAFERRVSWIMHRQHRVILGIPRVGEVKPSFLDPPGPVTLADAVGTKQDGRHRLYRRDVGRFVSHSVVAPE